MKNFLLKMKTKIVKKWNELMNDPAGPHLVALSFSVGVLAEMFTIPTLGLAFVVMLVIIKLRKLSMTSALVAYFFTKIVYIPLAPLELKVGNLILDSDFDPTGMKWAWLRILLHKDAELLAGASVVGSVLALIFYFVIKQILVLRLKRKARKVNSVN
jgi:uncharacterized protein (DUF2062 family)